MHAVKNTIGFRGRVRAGAWFGVLAALAFVGATSAEDTVQGTAKGPDATMFRFPDEMQLMNTVGVGTNTVAKVVGSGATVTNVNCDEFPDFCYISQSGKHLMLRLGEVFSTTDPPDAKSIDLQASARFVVVANFVPMQTGELVDCMEIAVVTAAPPKLLLYRWTDSGTTAQLSLFKTFALQHAPRAVAVANMDTHDLGEAWGVHPEIIIATKGSGKPQIRVYGMGPTAFESRFAPADVMSSADDPTSIDPADLDDDKDLDLDISSRSTLPIGGLQQRQTVHHTGYVANPIKNFSLTPDKPFTLPAP